MPTEDDNEGAGLSTLMPLSHTVAFLHLFTNPVKDGKEDVQMMTGIKW